MFEPRTVDKFDIKTRVKFIPKGCFEQNEINLVYGKYGAKKTTVMTAIANDLADKSCGGRGIDLEEDFKVLYFCSEGLPHVVDKFRKLNPMSDVEITGGYLDLGTWQQVADLAKYCQENTVRFVIIDTLSASLSEGSRNDDAKVNKVYTELRTRLCNNGITVVLVGHTGKSGTDVFGSYQWATDIPVIWYVDGKKLINKKFRNAETPNSIPFTCKYSEGIQTAVIHWDKSVEESSEYEQFVIEHKALGLSDKEIKDLLAEKEGLVKKSNAFHNKYRNTIDKLIKCGKLEDLNNKN